MKRIQIGGRTVRQYPDETFRASGRTSRILETVAEIARNGAEVYVIMVTEDHALKTARLFWSLYDPTCELPVSFVGLQTADDQGFDWVAMTNPRWSPTKIAVVDHFAIEAKFSRMLQMLHLFDPVIVPGVEASKPFEQPELPLFEGWKLPIGPGDDPSTPQWTCNGAPDETK